MEKKEKPKSEVMLPRQGPEQVQCEFQKQPKQR